MYGTAGAAAAPFLLDQVGRTKVATEAAPFPRVQVFHDRARQLTSGAQARQKPGCKLGARQ